MKYHSLIIIGLSWMLILFASCEEWIEVDQPDIIEQEQAFNDKNSTRLAMLGLYGLMADLVEPLFLAGEVRADLVVATKSADAYIKEFSNNSFSASNPYISPKPFYNLINNTNDFLYRFGEMVENQKMDSVDYVKYKSELIAIRVWTQYQVAKIFGSCKYYTHIPQPENSSEIESLPYGDALLEKLLNDIMYSDTNNFTSTAESDVWNSVRFSDYYVNTIMGELYLDLGDYENAFDKFNEVTRIGDVASRAAQRFNLSLPLRESAWMEELFIKNWENSRLIDNAVFIIAFDNKYNQKNDLFSWTRSMNYQVAPASWYYDHFNAYANADLEQPDPRFESLQYASDNIGLNSYYINKYVADDRPFIICRTARLELLKVYCMNLWDDKKGPNDAYRDLNKIRSRVGAPRIEQSLLFFNDRDTAMLWVEERILDEMAYETGFEGHRWFDLMRIARRKNDPAYLADRVAMKYPESLREEIRERLLDPENWYIPVFE
jgi:starch-binding outer membrane protein, SusD/RagB family